MVRGHRPCRYVTRDLCLAYMTRLKPGAPNTRLVP
jgi:hypothetical protein